ncbi:hypothetical protein VA7868_02927 [Vibrio aerogenes CECT 7868]|uniref:Chromosome partition protein Smc n=1 Tax=Vibrio aerogenes CECT 7868 TaxID=1216006 RepID=A0A1M5ZM99_9VIBR|nr:hypothetical protein [Vibrio aerogenes]SHI25304.1 hypothetical protein VA7868_02927 [Vibrio aerogenes CECT 7868]
MKINNPVDLSSDFAALAEKLAATQTEMQSSQSALSEAVTEKLDAVKTDVTESLSSVSEQASTTLTQTRTALESAIESTKTAVAATETAVITACSDSKTKVLTAISNHSVIRRIYQITVKSHGTINIPAVNPAKTFVNVNVEDSAGYAVLTSSTTLSLNRIGSADKYMRIQVIEYV